MYCTLYLLLCYLCICNDFFTPTVLQILFRKKCKLFTGNAVIGPRYLLEITQWHADCSKPWNRTEPEPKMPLLLPLPDSGVRSQSIGGTGSDHPSIHVGEGVERCYEQSSTAIPRSPESQSQSESHVCRSKKSAQTCLTRSESSFHPRLN